MAESSDPQRLLREFQKCNELFVGIDSDGCAFDTMEVKHKECFIPNIIRYYNLAAVSKYAREAAEFINLYSQWVRSRQCQGFPRNPGRFHPESGLSPSLDQLGAIEREASFL